MKSQPLGNVFSGPIFFTTLDQTIPVVFGGQPFHPEVHHNAFVDVDNRAGGELGTRRLLDLGRKRIATITGPQNMHAAIDRHQGWLDAVVGGGLSPELVTHGDYTLAKRCRRDARTAGSRARS